MKFSEMPYARPDLDAVKQQFADLLARFKAAATYAEAHAIFLEEEKLNKHVDTLAQLASVRNTIDTRDKFYDEEMNFWNEATPQLQECQNAWSRAMLDSPFRADFTAEYGDPDVRQRRNRGQGVLARHSRRDGTGKQADHRVRQADRVGADPV